MTSFYGPNHGKKGILLNNIIYLNSCFHDHFSHMWFTLLRINSLHEQFACENEVNIDEQKLIAM
jgi:hypothetical protein